MTVMAAEICAGPSVTGMLMFSSMFALSLHMQISFYNSSSFAAALDTQGHCSCQGL